jgi:hypothetical protein
MSVTTYVHLNPDLAGLMSAPKEQRISFLHEPIWINHHVSSEITQLLNQLLIRPKKARMQSLLIIAEANMGKTSLVGQFSKMHEDKVIEDESNSSTVIKSVIKTDAPASADEKGLYIAILEQFWTTFRPTDTNAKLRHQVLFLMRECNVKMLIIDEIHNLLGGTAAKQRTVMNSIKSLSNELMIPIVGVGTSDAAIILTNDPQHASRFDVVTIPRWSLDKNFRGLLAAFEKKLPLKKPSLLHKADKAPLLLSISAGNIGNLHRLLIECATYAINEDIEEITLNIIQKYAWLKPTSSKRPREIVLDNV